MEVRGGTHFGHVAVSLVSRVYTHYLGVFISLPITYLLYSLNSLAKNIGSPMSSGEASAICILLGGGNVLIVDVM